jgi:hypothetical protein
LALTLVQRETFQGVGTLNSGTPGNLGAVNTGNFYKRAVGPRVTGDTTANSLGWSADMRLVSAVLSNVYHTVTITATAAASLGCFSSFYRMGSVSNNVANRGYLSNLVQANGNQLVKVLISSATGTFWYNSSSNFTDTDSGVTYPVRQWFELRHSWKLNSSTRYDFQVAFRLAGSSTWTTIYSVLNLLLSGALISARGGSVALSNSYGTFRGRYGMPALYQMDAYADATLALPDVVDPTNAGTTWYLNPSTGSDTNDGVTAASPWQTVGKFNTESQYGGLFGAATYPTGDTLELDTSGAVLDLGGTQMLVKTPGINIRPPTGQTYADVKLWKDITSATWALESGTSHVYSTTDGGATDKVGVVIWENDGTTDNTGAGDKWLTHPTGAAFTNVKATMDATPGSFYSDGTKVYLHPFGSTVPSADGKTYSRSRNYGSGSGLSTIDITVPDVHLKGIRCGKDCLARSTDHDPYVSDLIQTEGSDGGTSLFEGLYLFHWGKHAISFTGNTLTRTYTVQDSQFEQGSPYASQTVLVDYTSQSANGACVTYYTRCTSLHSVGLIGSAAGSTAASVDALFSHNNGSGTQFTQYVTDCNFPTGGIGGNYPALAAQIISNTIFAGGLSGAAIFTADRCKFTYKLATGNGLGVVTVTNSLLPLTTAFNSGLANNRGVKGTTVYRGCTIDLRGVPSGDDVQGGVFLRQDASNLTVENCVVIINAADAWTVFQNFLNTDTLTIGHNEYVLGSAAKLHRQYNDGSTTADRTLAQAQTLGLDAGSAALLIAALTLNLTTYARTGQASVTNDLGSMTDYTGVTFADRQTPGAYEYIPDITPGPYSVVVVECFTPGAVAFEAFTPGAVALEALP